MKPTPTWIGCCALAAIASASVHAAPVEFDTDDAHVIVVRPVDRWSGDSTAADVSLDAVRSHEASYGIVTPDGRHLRGSPMLMMGASDDPVVHQVEANLQQRGVELIRRQHYFFTVLGPVSVPPADFPAFAEAQTLGYKRLAALQGDPDTLRDRTSRRRLIGNVASLAVLGLGVEKLGLEKPGLVRGTGIVLGMDLTADIQRVASNLSGAFIPIPTAGLQETFRQIDVRRVQYRADMMGQIIIAYRHEKTPESELAALSKAIVTVTGADTTPADIEQARAEEFSTRRAMWSDCVAANLCQTDEGKTPGKGDAKRPETGEAQ
jgi:hypothetical protein